MLLVGLALILPKLTLAHCPLCTVGAGLAAVLAVSFGVSTASVGVFVGAFAIAIGLWIGKILPKQYIRFQIELLAVLSFLLTIFPILPIMDSGYFSLYIGWLGEYGTTFALNRFLVGSVVGAVLMFLAPLASRALTRVRAGRRFSYQGIVIAFSLLVIGALIFQFIL